MNHRNADHLFTGNNRGVIGKHIGCPDTNAGVKGDGLLSSDHLYEVEMSNAD